MSIFGKDTEGPISPEQSRLRASEMVDGATRATHGDKASREALGIWLSDEHENKAGWPTIVAALEHTKGAHVIKDARGNVSEIAFSDQNGVVDYKMGGNGMTIDGKSMAEVKQESIPFQVAANTERLNQLPADVRPIVTDIENGILRGSLKEVNQAVLGIKSDAVGEQVAHYLGNDFMFSQWHSAANGHGSLDINYLDQDRRLLTDGHTSRGNFSFLSESQRVGNLGDLDETHHRSVVARVIPADKVVTPQLLGADQRDYF